MRLIVEKIIQYCESKGNSYEEKIKYVESVLDDFANNKPNEQRDSQKDCNSICEGEAGIRENNCKHTGSHWETRLEYPTPGESARVEVCNICGEILNYSTIN